MPKKKKPEVENVISLARQTNDSSRYTTRELLEDLVNSDIPEEYNRSITFVFNSNEEDGMKAYKFNYYTSGFKDRVELLGGLTLLKSIVIDELFE